MKILVRAPNWIGDSILAIPAIQSLAHADPETEIWVAAKPWVKDLFLSYPFIKGVIPLPDESGLSAMRRTSRGLKEHGFHAGLLLTNSFGSALPLLWARIPDRWGFAADGRSALLTRSLRRPAPEVTLHQVRYYLNLITGLGLEAANPVLSFPLEAGEIQGATRLLSAAGIAPNAPLVLLNPGGYFGSAKRWPPDRFSALAALYQEKMRAQIVIVGSENEASLAEAIAKPLASPPVILTGKTSLRQLASIIHAADLCVTNDSGPMHLANAIGTPVLAIFGPTDPGATAPFQDPSAYIHKPPACWPCAYRDCPFDHRCMEAISPEEVFALSQGWLP